MSIPGDQPNPYARPPQPHSPYSAPGMPVGQTGVPPHGATFGQGIHAEPGVGGPGMPAVGAVPGGPRNAGGAGPRIPGWVWGVGGVVLASAVWGATAIMSGGFHDDSDPDLAGYHFHQDLCEAVGRDAFDEHYVPAEREPLKSRHATHEALDSSTCALRFKDGAGNDDGEGGYDAPGRDSGLSTTYVDFDASWHKKSDPGAEFEARVRSNEQYSTADDVRFTVEEVEELGEQAFLTTNSSEDGPPSNVTLTVRDGWVEVRVDWRKLSAGTQGRRLSKSEVEQMLVKSMKSTLTALREPPDSEKPRGPNDSEEPGEPPKRGEGDI